MYTFPVGDFVAIRNSLWGQCLALQNPLPGALPACKPPFFDAPVHFAVVIHLGNSLNFADQATVAAKFCGGNCEGSSGAGKFE